MRFPTFSQSLLFAALRLWSSSLISLPKFLPNQSIPWPFPLSIVLFLRNSSVPLHHFLPASSSSSKLGVGGLTARQETTVEARSLPCLLIFFFRIARRLWYSYAALHSLPLSLRLAVFLCSPLYSSHCVIEAHALRAPLFQLASLLLCPTLSVEENCKTAVGRNSNDSEK